MLVNIRVPENFVNVDNGILSHHLYRNPLCYTMISHDRNQYAYKKNTNYAREYMY